MKDTLLNLFLNQTYSTHQAQQRLILLRNYFENKFFKTSVNFQKDPWTESLGEQFFKQFTAINVYKILSDLEKRLQSLKKLTIFVAFEIPDDEIDKIGANLRKNIKDLFLLETKIDPALIAGAALSWKGVYKDFSLRQTIEENKERILSSFKSYLK